MKNTKMRREELGRRLQRGYELLGYTKNLKEFCLNEGLSTNFMVKASTLKTSVSLEFIKELVFKFKKLFESYGFGPDEVIKYLNENAILLDITSNTLKYNFALYDYAGVLEDAIFEDPHTLLKNHNPKDLYAVIKWLKDSKEAQRGITLPEIRWYLDNLPLQALRELRSEYPLTISKYGLIESRHEALINARLKGNKAYAKSFSIPSEE